MLYVKRCVGGLLFCITPDEQACSKCALYVSPSHQMNGACPHMPWVHVSTRKCSSQMPQGPASRLHAKCINPDFPHIPKLRYPIRPILSPAQRNGAVCIYCVLKLRLPFFLGKSGIMHVCFRQCPVHSADVLCHLILEFKSRRLILKTGHLSTYSTVTENTSANAGRK